MDRRRRRRRWRTWTQDFYKRGNLLFNINFALVAAIIICYFSLLFFFSCSISLTYWYSFNRKEVNFKVIYIVYRFFSVVFSMLCYFFLSIFFLYNFLLSHVICYIIQCSEHVEHRLSTKRHIYLMDSMRFS